MSLSFNSNRYPPASVLAWGLCLELRLTDPAFGADAFVGRESYKWPARLVGKPQED